MGLWAYQWKMSFNPDRTKPDHEVVFSRKTKNIIYRNLCTWELTYMRSLRLMMT